MPLEGASPVDCSTAPFFAGIAFEFNAWRIDVIRGPGCDRFSVDAVNLLATVSCLYTPVLLGGGLLIAAKQSYPA
jgi:hypothetical protein